MDNNSLENIVIAEKKRNTLRYYNPEQNIVDKSTKKSNVGFPIDFFTADFLQFCSATVKVLPFGVAG